MSAYGKRVRDLAAAWQALNGYATYLGTITATTVTDNAHTASTFVFQGGEQVLLQPDTACYVAAIAQGNANAVSSKMVLLQANEKYYMLMPSSGSSDQLGDTAPLLSCIAVTGTTNLKVFTLG